MQPNNSSRPIETLEDPVEVYAGSSNDASKPSFIYRSHRLLLSLGIIVLILLIGLGGYGIYRLAAQNQANQPKKVQDNINLNTSQASQGLTLPQRQTLLINSNLKVISNTGLQGNLNVVGTSTLQGNVIIKGNLVVSNNIQAKSFSGNGSHLINLNASLLNSQPASFI